MITRKRHHRSECNVSRKNQYFFSSHRKIMKVNGMEVASWKSIRPQTPQQRDARSCGVFVIKVGLWYAFIIGLFLLTKRGGAVLVEYRPEVLSAAMSLQKRPRANRATRLVDFCYCYWLSDCPNRVMQYIKCVSRLQNMS